MEDILKRLESANEFCESMEARQLRKDAAEEIRKLRQEVRALLAALHDELNRVE